ncbi:MAG: gliding motility-associated C-terminal domain-containing protein, partial [Bacteroidota bacterium]
SDIRGQLAKEAVFNYSADTSEQIIVEAYYGGCTVVDSITIVSNELIATLGDTEVNLPKGSSIPLEVMGKGIVQYQWSPEEGLDNPTISRPIASPRNSVVYTVALRDTLGCEAFRTVQINVVDQGWIPNLFTPNSDGNNDRLRIYGLENVADFEFFIFNRSGNLVYQSKNISDISDSGWDGTHQGRPMPIGIYRWQVKGKLDDGSNLMLNGKNSGVINLLR